MLEAVFSEGKMKACMIYDDGEDINIHVDAIYKEEDTEATYAGELKVSVAQDDTEMGDIILAIDYNKSTGAWEATFTFDNKVQPDEDMTASAKGTLVWEEDVVTFTVTEVSAADVTLALTVRVTFDASAEAPAAPDNATDVMDMTAEDLEALMEEITSSRLFELFGSLGGNATPDGGVEDNEIVEKFPEEQL